MKRTNRLIVALTLLIALLAITIFALRPVLRGIREKKAVEDKITVPDTKTEDFAEILQDYQPEEPVETEPAEPVDEETVPETVIDAPVETQESSAEEAAAETSVDPEITPEPEVKPEQEEETEPEVEIKSTDIIPDIAAPELPEEISASGNFLSCTSTALNLDVNWYVFTDEAGEMQLALDIALRSYSLKVSNRTQGLTIQLGSETYTYDTPEIQYTGTDEIRNRICSVILPIEKLPQEIEVRWLFRGVYSGREIEYITAYSLIELPGEAQSEETPG